MRKDNLKFVGQIRKGNLIITTFVDANNNEFRFGQLVKRKVSTNVVEAKKVEEVEVIAPTVVEEKVVTTVEDDLEIPYFMTKEYRRAKKAVERIKREVISRAI